MAEDKIFTFKGKTLEELQAMSIEDFGKLLPSRERRKMARGFAEAEKIFLSNLESGSKKLKTHARDMIVLPNMVDKKIGIHNGKEFVEVKIAPEMLGMRFGELAPSRRIAVHTTMGSKKLVVRK